MIRLKLEDVNRRYSQTWVKCNDDAQREHFKKLFIQQFGGEFVRDGSYFRWQKIEPVNPRRKFVFEGPDSELHFIENMYDFCKKNGLNRSPMYEMIAGKRKQYKKYKFVSEIPWQA